MPFWAYQKADAVNQSSITRALRGEDWTKPYTMTTEFRLGQLFHTLILEPKEFYDESKTMITECETRREKKFKELSKSNLDKTLVTQREIEKLKRMEIPLKNHSDYNKYFSGLRVEETYIWKEPHTGMLCKSRLDGLNSFVERIVDLKTTRSAEEFEHSIEQYRYDIQAAFYIDAVKQISGLECEFVFCAVDKKESIVRFITLDDESIEKGRQDYLVGLEIIKKGKNE